MICVSHLFQCASHSKNKLDWGTQIALLTQPAPVAAPPPLPAELNSRQFYNSTTGQAQCVNGWSNPDCGACESDQACAAYFDENNATCSSSPVYELHSTFMAYTCNLTVGAARW